MTEDNANNSQRRYIIGLTGNIGTGKSVVRQILEEFGADGIDADAITHRVISRSGPAYQRVVEEFGRWILEPDGEINRGRLGKIVFNSPEALKILEGIVHPYVIQGGKLLIRKSTSRVIVVEAIKLLETELRSLCDTIWVTVVSETVQVQRLMVDRGLSEAEALARIKSQPAQEGKVAAANIVISNDGTIKDLWLQVKDAIKTIPTESA